MDAVNSQVKNVFNSTLALALFGVIGSSISTPGKITNLYTQNRVFRFFYFFIGCYAALNFNLVHTVGLVIALLAFYDLMRDGEKDSYQPFFGPLLQNLI